MKVSLYFLNETIVKECQEILKDENIHSLLRFSILRFLKSIESDVESFIKTKEVLIKEYGTEMEDGSFTVISKDLTEDRFNEFTKKFEELANNIIELKDQKFKLSTFSNSPQHYKNWMFELTENDTNI